MSPDLAALKRAVSEAMAADRRERDRLLDVERRRIVALQAEADELRALVRSLRDNLAKHVGDERIAEISGERKVA